MSRSIERKREEWVGGCEERRVARGGVTRRWRKKCIEKERVGMLFVLADRGFDHKGIQNESEEHHEISKHPSGDSLSRGPYKKREKNGELKIVRAKEGCASYWENDNKERVRECVFLGFET